MVALLLSLTFAAGAADAPDTVIVCPAEFRQALRPWIEHRAAQGHRLTFVAGDQTPEAIRDDIRRVAELGALKTVVLIGDADPAAKVDARVRVRSVPTNFAEAKVNIRWGSEPEIASDNPYADLDGDQLPDVSIGRLTADSKEELALMVRKILAYERDADHGAWRRQLNFVAGVGGFGKLTDAVLETATKRLVTNEIPAAYETSMTYGSWSSPFCPDPRHFHRATLDRLNEGCLFWVYIGHGHRHGLDRVRVPGSLHHILAVNDADKLDSAAGLPIAVFLACYTGALDDPRDCLAEEMLRAERGPVAVYAGSRVTMPYAMAVMSHEMLRGYFQERPQTLGELILHAKRRMAAPATTENGNRSTSRVVLDTIATLISPSAGMLDEERAEHLLLYNLLGDPLLRLPHADGVKVTAASAVFAGDSLEIECDCPLAGKCTVELVCRRDQLRVRPPPREQYDASDEALAKLDEVYGQANDRRWVFQSLDVQSGPLRTTLRVPADAFGPAHVRVYVAGQGGSALGSADVLIRRLADEAK